MRSTTEQAKESQVLTVVGTSNSVPPNSPYTVGQVLSLDILDGSTKLPSKSQLTVRIEHIFLPYTKAQAMRVQVLSPLPSEDQASEFHKLAVLKLYDHRWNDDRIRGESTTTWTVARELAAQQRRRAIALGTLVDDFETISISSDRWDESYEEENYRLMAEERFDNEREAYHRLVDLQGTMIPKCYAAVAVSAPGDDRDEYEHSVFGLLLELIGGTPADMADSASPSYRPHRLLECVSMLPRFGVLHGDLRLANMILSPTRAVLIDFGHAILRQEDDADAEWAEKVRFEDEVEAVRRILYRAHLRDRSPYDPGKYTNYTINSGVEAAEESWRGRWYDRVGGPPLQKVAGDVRDPDEPMRWEMRADVRTWFDSRPPAPECFRLPRPGSPVT